MFEVDWTPAQLAHAVCDCLVKNGKLKEKPAFIRTDREAKIAGYFDSGGLDGAKMDSFDNPGPLEMLVRKVTSGEPWVEHVVEALVEMLPESAAKAKKKMGMDDQTRAALEEAQEKTAQRRERQDNDGGRDRDDGGRDERGGGGRGFRDRDDDREERGGQGGGKGGRSKGGGYGSRDADREERGGWSGGRGDKPSGGDTEAKKEKGGGKGRRDRGEMICLNCKQPGHKSRDCPEPVDEDAVRERLAAKAEKDAKRRAREEARGD
mmetsp:Transcript_10472/g.23525  ORF Transcript_10472/g.23525 Transcript_10472/m.23525 type:complete len:264 (+) Transcript_10472:58-849(+)